MRTGPKTDGRRCHRNRFPHGLLLAALLLRAGCTSPDPRPVDLYPEDMCAYCRMAVSDHRCASEIVAVSGEVFKFDDLSCLERFRAARGDVNGGAIFVKDYETKDWLRLERAVIIETGVFTPMGSGKLAFRDSTRARLFLSQNPVSR